MARNIIAKTLLVLGLLILLMPQQVWAVNPQVAAGAEHTVLLKRDGTVWIWGAGSGWPAQVEGLSNVIAIAAGDYHTVVVKGDGTVWAWGDNSMNQLGDGTTAYQRTPIQVKNLSDVKAVAAGEGHTLALKNDGTVWAWGNISWVSSYFYIGDTPKKVSGIENAIAIAAGGNFSLSIKSGGGVSGWGDNVFGEIGCGFDWVPSPIDISSNSVYCSNLSMGEIFAISGGYRHSVAI